MNAVSPVIQQPQVYQAIAAVQGELAKTGIAKNRENSQQGYSFRGIDDVYGALAPLLAKHGLCVLPRIVSREMRERVTVKTWNGQSKESVLFYVTVEAEFDFVSSADGTSHTVRTFGEAMDSGDKATNKAMSAAYKYAAFMTFAIPTEGDNDADATTHEVAAEKPEKSRAKAADPITDEQRDMIQTLAPSAGRTVKEICGLYEIASLKELTFTKASSLIKRLEGDAKAKTEKPQADDILDDEVPY